MVKLARRSIVEAPFVGHGLYANVDAPVPQLTLAEFQASASVDLRFGICDERSKTLGMSANLFVDSLFASVMALMENNN